MTFNNNLLLGAAGQSGGGGGFDVPNAVLLKSASSQYFNRTPGVVGTSRKIFTISTWLRLSDVSSYQAEILHVGSASGTSNTDWLQFYYDANKFKVGGWSGEYLATTAVYRDPSSWLHVVLAVDTTQATASNRMRLYVNGSEVTAFTTATYPTLNQDTPVNNTQQHNIGARTGGSVFYNSYLSEYCIIDGQQLDPTSFGEFDDNGVWRPIDVSGLTFGTNGFYITSADGVDQNNGALNPVAANWSRDTASWTFSGSNVATSAGDKYIVGPRITGDFSITMDVVNQGALYVGLAINSNSFASGTWSDAGRTMWCWKGDGTSPGIYDNNGGGSQTLRQATSDNDLDGVTLTIKRVGGTISWEKDGTPYYSHALTNSGTLQFIVATTGTTSAVDVDNIAISAGVGNHFVPVNTPTDTLDTPTTIYPTINPLATASGVLSDGNLYMSKASGANWYTGLGTIGVPPTGKWAFKFTTPTAGANKTNVFAGFLLQDYDANVLAAGTTPSSFSDAVYCYLGVGEFTKKVAGSATTTSGLTAFAAGDTGEFLIDQDAGEAKIYRLGSLLSTHTGLPVMTDVIATVYGDGRAISFDFGQGGYTPTDTAYLPLNSANIYANDPPAIKEGEKYFNTITYTGNGGDQRIGPYYPIAEAYTIDNSALFDASSSAYLSRTPGVAGNKQTFTVSTWFKLGIIPSAAERRVLFSANSANPYFRIEFHLHGYILFLQWIRIMLPLIVAGVCILTMKK